MIYGVSLFAVIVAILVGGGVVAMWAYVVDLCRVLRNINRDHHVPALYTLAVVVTLLALSWGASYVYGHYLS